MKKRKVSLSHEYSFVDRIFWSLMLVFVFTLTFIFVYASQTINLSDASSKNITFYGIEESRTGVGVATGDLNNDGVLDLILGAPNASGENSGTARIYIIYGPFEDGSNQEFNVTNVVNITINSTDDRMGRSLATGDLNNDGITDLIAGANKAETGLDLNSGRTYVFYGPFPNGNVNYSADDIVNVSYWGKNNTQSASGVDSGDLNNDGIDDLIIGSSNANPENRSNAGEVYVIYGPLANGSNQEFNITSVVNITLNGEVVNSNFGKEVTSGDLNNDGIIDLAVGLNTVSNSGETNVIYGSLPNGFNQSINVSIRKNITITGIDSGDGSGSGLATGDLNNDGLIDLIIGARDADPNGVSSAGEAYVFYGSFLEDLNQSFEISDIVDITYNGIDSSDFVGDAISTGDLNNDGVTDLVISANQGDPYGFNAAGEVYVIYLETPKKPSGGGGGADDIFVSIIEPVEEEIIEKELECFDDDWVCSVWGKCINGFRIRDCVFEGDSACILEVEIPLMKEECIVEETCNDGIKNQGEEGVDCGRPCELCKIEQPIVEKGNSLLIYVIILIILGVGALLYIRQRHHR